MVEGERWVASPLYPSAGVPKQGGTPKSRDWAARPPAAEPDAEFARARVLALQLVSVTLMGLATQLLNVVVHTFTEADRAVLVRLPLGGTITAQDVLRTAYIQTSVCLARVTAHAVREWARYNRSHATGAAATLTPRSIELGVLRTLRNAAFGVALPVPGSLNAVVLDSVRDLLAATDKADITPLVVSSAAADAFRAADRAAQSPSVGVELMSVVKGGVL